MPAATTHSDQQSNPFIKQLASSNRQTRDKALDSLRTFLQRSTPFSELDLLKLWKGLFFCMWMSDKPLTQQRLARDLAALLDAVNGRENWLGFVNAFWATMAREWSGIDALRMDKFLYLVRCYVGKGFECVSRNDWRDEELLEAYLEILVDVPLNVKDDKIPNGLRYHVVDIYVDELDKVDTKRTAPVEKILAPMTKLGKESLNKAMRFRVQEALDDERLVDWQNTQAKQDVSAGEDDEVHQRKKSNNMNDTSSVEEDGDEEFRGFDD